MYWSTNMYDITTQPVKSKTEREQAAINFYYERLTDFNEKTNFVKNLIEKFPNTKKFNVISIGFGKYPIEFQALKKLFNEHGLDINFNGYEVNENKLNYARKQYASEENIKLHLIDGTDYSAIGKTLGNDPVHIMVLRHPVLNPKRRDVNAPFRSIFTETVPFLLAEDGCLLTSIYTDPEAEKVRELMKTIDCPNFKELKPAQTVFWKAEKSTVQWGYSGITSQSTDLWAEKYFFGVSEFKPSHFFALEKNKIEFNQEKSNKLFGVLDSLINSVQNEYYLPVQKSARVNFIFSKLLNIMAQKPADFSKIDEMLKNELQNKMPKDFEALVDQQLKDVTWSYSAWDDHPENQRILLQRICDAFTLLSGSADLNTQTASERQLHFLHALKVVAERPVPSELNKHKVVPDTKLPEEHRYSTPMYW